MTVRDAGIARYTGVGVGVGDRGWDFRLGVTNSFVRRRYRLQSGEFTTKDRKFGIASGNALAKGGIFVEERLHVGHARFERQDLL